MANLFEIDLPPMAFHPNDAGNAPSLQFADQTVIYRQFWAFDSGISENITSQQLILPENMNSSGSMKLKILTGNAGASPTASNKTVRWAVYTECITTGVGGDLILGSSSLVDLTPNTGVVTLDESSNQYMYETNITLTNDDSAGAGKPFRLALQRDVATSSSANYAGDVNFYGAMLYQESS